MFSKPGIFGFLLGVVLFAAISFPESVYGEERVHTVRGGETFFSIARTFGLRAEDLMRFNGVTDPSRLQVGQRLRIPASAAAAGSAVSSESSGFTTYRVVRGDTFFSLTRRFSASEREIRTANNLSETYILREGDVLRIPTETRGTAEPRVAAEPRVPIEPGVPVETRPVQVVAMPPALNAAEVSQARAVEARTVSSAVTWPVNAREISYMTGRLSGVMITGERLEPVRSLTHGTVISVGPYRGFGRVAIVQVEGGYLYVYGGSESLSVKEGDRVNPGTEIGRLGIDTVSNKPQLFFMVYRSNAPVDPAVAPRA